ncbi:uncharacterized protein UTRI_06109 [Ustilago trichophora]|uniref:Uncharacterized protein n=1 Tax=Ustilago trichophora TaxID=86804 RepID=A0A5C3EFY2_9BASI|nr:uncharacterized protein UTRI_06109 [Ustilago trichophora]
MPAFIVGSAFKPTNAEVAAASCLFWTLAPPPNTLAAQRLQRERESEIPKAGYPVTPLLPGGAFDKPQNGSPEAKMYETTAAVQCRTVQCSFGDQAKLKNRA